MNQERSKLKSIYYFLTSYKNDFCLTEYDLMKNNKSKEECEDTIRIGRNLIKIDIGDTISDNK